MKVAQWSVKFHSAGIKLTRIFRGVKVTMLAYGKKCGPFVHHVTQLQFGHYVKLASNQHTSRELFGNLFV